MYDPQLSGHSETPMMPLPRPMQPPPPGPAEPAAPLLTAQQKKRAYYLVVSVLFGVPALFALMYGSVGALMFGFLFVAFMGVPWYMRKVRRDVEKWKSWLR